MKNLKSIRRIINLSLSSFIIFSVSTFSGYSQQMSKMDIDTSAIKQKEINGKQDQKMLPMAFFTHMAIPLNVGSYSLRVAALPTQKDGKTNTQFNFQFETGLSKVVGLFLGGEGLFDDATLEAMVQFLVIKSKNGYSGFSPIIEFEFPVNKGTERSVYTLVGFATTLSNSHLAFNQVLHYSPIENLAEGSISLLFKVSKRIFLVSELSGVTQKDTYPIANILGGVKIKLNQNFLLGFALELPLTVNREYSSRYVFQPNIMLQK